MKCHVSEKTFEHHIIGELSQFAQNSYSPDQVAEKGLGFDASFFLPHRFLFGTYPLSGLNQKLNHGGVSFENMNWLGKELNNVLPRFKLNMFFQFKRPIYLTRKSANEWGSWNQRYYSYDIEEKQQETLEKLAAFSKGFAQVLYASYACYDKDQYFHISSEKRVLDITNIVEAEELKNHHKYSYVKAGHEGMAHSSAEEVSGMPIEELLSSRTSNDGQSFTENIKIANKVIGKMLREDRKLNLQTENAKKAIKISRELGSITDRPLDWFDATLNLIAFNHVTNIRFLSLTD